MKTKIISALYLLSTITLAQNNTENSTSKKSLPSFNAIEVTAPTTVVLKKAENPYYIVQSDDTTDIGVRVDVVDGKLVVKTKKQGEVPDKITVGYTNLNEIEATGAATVKSGDAMNLASLQVNASGASKIKLDLNVANLSVTISGASTCILNGSCNKMEAIVSGASSLKAEGMVAENADINTSGAATSRVNVSNRLVGNASGASNFKFTGNPKEVQVNQSGTANVKQTDSGNSVSVSVDSASAGTSGNRDSTRKYTINGRYEIVVHDNYKSDTTTRRYKIKHDGRIRKQNWAGVDLFENGYLTPGGSVTMPASADYMSLNYGMRNLGWNLNLFEKDFRFAKGHGQVVTGMGFSFNYYNLTNRTTLNADSSFTSTLPYNMAADYKKNRLRESFLTVPLLLELNTSRRDSRNFHIAAGVIGGIKLGSSTKQIFTVNNHTYETIRHDDYNLFPFKLDATVRIGYGDFTLFGTYSLTPLFEKGKGPEVYPFTVGIRICPF